MAQPPENEIKLRSGKSFRPEHLLPALQSCYCVTREYGQPVCQKKENTGNVKRERQGRVYNCPLYCDGCTVNLVEEELKDIRSNEYRLSLEIRKFLTTRVDSWRVSSQQ